MKASTFLALLFLTIFSVGYVESSKHRNSSMRRHRNPLLEATRRKQTTNIDIKSHEVAKNLNQNLVCSRVKDDPNRRSFHLRQLTLDGVVRDCCVCNRGEKLVGLCSPGSNNQSTTDCRECGDGTYMPHYSHNYTECLPDTLNCSKEEIYVPSNKTNAPECLCRDDEGLFRAPDGTCVLHSPCKFGEGVKIRGTPFRDTVCEACPRGYISPTSSATETCFLDKSLLLLPKNQYILASTPTPVAPFSSQYIPNSSSIERCPTPASTRAVVEEEGEVQQCDGGGGGSPWYAWAGVWFSGIVTAILFFVLYIYCGKKVIDSYLPVTWTKRFGSGSLYEAHENTTSPAAVRGSTKNGSKRQRRSDMQVIENVDPSSSRSALLPKDSAQPCTSGGGFGPALSQLPHTSSKEINRDANNKKILEEIAKFFEEASRGCYLHLDNDVVARFCHLKDYPPPPTQDSGLQRMAGAIRKGVTLNKIKMADVRSFLLKNNLITVEEKLRNYLWSQMSDILL